MHTCMKVCDLCGGGIDCMYTCECVHACVYMHAIPRTPHKLYMYIFRIHVYMYMYMYITCI